MPRREKFPLSRRALLSSAAAAWAGTSLSRALAARDRSVAKTTTTGLRSGPFTLGVASGDPTPDGFVLWTRLAPDPLRGGGMPPQAVVVTWQVGTDEGMNRIVREGKTVATAAFAHAVHVEVAGLESGRWYWYRFQAGGEVSPTGRTRTAPDRHAPVQKLAFATASCHHWQAGLYTGYQHLAAEELDFVVHLGDYIYEGGVDSRAVRPHNGPEAKTLEDYRNRYALYKTDPHLQAAHAAFPWMVIWDDHEVIDNYSGPHDRYSDDPQQFLRRRAAAYQAFYEHLPLRLTSMPNGAGHVALPPDRFRRPPRPAPPRHPPVPQLASQPPRARPARPGGSAGESGRQPARAAAGVLAARGPAGLARPLERPRPGDLRRPAPVSTCLRIGRAALYPGQVGRLPGRPPAPDPLLRRAAHPQPAGPHRRRSPHLDRRPEG